MRDKGEIYVMGSELNKKLGMWKVGGIRDSKKRRAEDLGVGTVDQLEVIHTIPSKRPFLGEAKIHRILTKKK